MQTHCLPAVIAGGLLAAGLAIALSCGPSAAGDTRAHGSEVAPSFASEQRLQEHWEKHGKNPAEFQPPLTRDEYLRRACDFMASTDPRILTKERWHARLPKRPGPDLQSDIDSANL